MIAFVFQFKFYVGYRGLATYEIALICCVTVCPMQCIMWKSRTHTPNQTGVGARLFSEGRSPPGGGGDAAAVNQRRK